jgi:hypothetical protein
MAVVAYNQKELSLLARLMRAEAEEDGQMGMLMVATSALTVFSQIAWISRTSTQSKGWYTNDRAALNLPCIPISIRPPGPLTKNLPKEF